MTENQNPGARRKALAAEAAATEEENADILKLTFRGVPLTVPTGDEMDVDTMAHWERGQIVLFVMAAVGDAQWRKLKAAKVTKVRDLKELANAIFEAMGTSSGE